MPNFDIEKEMSQDGFVFGIDEAGRGPWCGPVVAACVSWPNYEIPETLLTEIDDSKKLSAKKREVLYQKILDSNAVIGVGLSTAEEIDNTNILQATFLAMQRALSQAKEKNTHIKGVLIDGNRLPKNWDLEAKAVVKGDHLSLSIASASIIAKVTRDKMMQEYAKKYPMYGWEKNAGYGTKDHILAIEEHGITPIHRKSYAPIKKYIETKKVK